MFAPHIPKQTYRHSPPGRCWRLSLRDRVAWRIFVRVANPAVASVVWDNYRWSRDAIETRWTFGDGGQTETQVGATAP